MSAPNVRKMLDLSTAHLPERFFNEVEGDEPNAVIDGYDETWRTVVYPTDYGALLWVPADPTESSEEGQEEATAPEVLKVQLYARSLGCDYVMFDRDADADPALPTWEW